MIMIQDTFGLYVIPRINTEFRKMFVISDEMGRPILTEEAKALGIVSTTFDLKFRHDLPEEWSKELSELRDDKNKYPFLFIDSTSVVYEDNGNVTIGYMVLATLSKDSYYSGQRDIRSYKPYLNNLDALLEDTMHHVFGTQNPLPCQKRILYKGKLTGQKQPQDTYIDAIEYKNLKLRILNNC